MPKETTHATYTDKCPNCDQDTLTWDEEMVLVTAVKDDEGKLYELHYCTNCGYEDYR